MSENLRVNEIAIHLPLVVLRGNSMNSFGQLTGTAVIRGKKGGVTIQFGECSYREQGCFNVTRGSLGLAITKHETSRWKVHSLGFGFRGKVAYLGRRAFCTRTCAIVSFCTK